MQKIDTFFKSENLELYLIAFLLLFTIWFIVNTIKYYYGEKRKVRNLHRFAKEGEREAQHTLAKRYQKGDFVKKNCERAAFWYQSAALKGDVEAKGHLEQFLKNHQQKKC